MTFHIAVSKQYGKSNVIVKVLVSMPRRSTRNIAKDVPGQDSAATDPVKAQGESAVVDVIDEFVAVAEGQEGIENEETISTPNDLPKANTAPDVSLAKYIYS